MVQRLNLSISWKLMLNDKFSPEILQLLQCVRPKWCEIGEKAVKQKVRFKVLSGGYSNYMVAYYIDGNFHKDAVIVRMNGEDKDPFFDKHQEVENVKILHKAGRGPPLYAVFNNGMSYRFVNGVALDENTVKEKHIQKLIAKEIIGFHEIQVEGRERQPAIWALFHKLLQQVPTTYKDPAKNTRLLREIQPKRVLYKELCQLKQHLDELQSPIVFCHNDLRPSNILYDQKNDRLVFIDVETAMYNNEHFDIGNHFVEYAGTENINHSHFPDKGYQLSWLRYYLEQKVNQKGSTSHVTDKDVESCYVKVNKFSLAPNLGWALWGLAMAEKVNIEFDYLEYAKKKLDVYFSKKEEILSMKVPK